MLKKIFITGACLLSGVSLLNLPSITEAADDFFIPSIEHTVDRGLVVEIVLTCTSRMNDTRSNSIMSYSKAEKQFCTAKNNCYSKARSAAIESCNHDETVLTQLQKNTRQQ